MSDPITDFIKNQNEERITPGQVDYDPIVGFRRALDQVSGAEIDESFNPEQIDQVESLGSRRIVTGYKKGGKQAAADVNYMKGAFKALIGDEEGAKRAVMKGVKDADEASKTVGALDMAQEWEKFLDAPDFESFMRAAPATVGEVGLSALTSITGALVGVAIAAYTAPVSVPTAAAAALTGAAGKKSLDKITKQLAFTHFTKDIIAESVKRAALKKTLTNQQKDVMNAVYKQYQKNALSKRKLYGSIAGVTAAEFPRTTGQAFSTYADQDMYDPISAGLSIAQGGVNAVIGGATEGLVLNKLVGAFARSTAFKSRLTPAGANYKPPSITKEASKALGISLVGEPTTEVLQSAVESGQKFGMYDPRLEGQLDKEYTRQQAALDLQISALAGLTAGGAFGSGGAISVGAVTGAQNLLREYQQRDALTNMIYAKYGEGGTGVQIEPKQWIRDQFDALGDKTNDKDTIWIDVNSLDEFQEFLNEREQEFKIIGEQKYGGEKILEALQGGKVNPNYLFRYDMANQDTQLGGILLSRDPQKIRGFQQVMENNMPSQALLDNELARVLDYPRTRQNSDQWVVQVRNKETGGLVHYHQTGDPKEEGGVHLENAKKLFNNSPKYSYEIVDAETHLEERRNLVDDPAVDLSEVKPILTEEQAAEATGRTSAKDAEGMTGLRDETGRYAQAADVVEDPVAVTPRKEEGAEPIRNKNNRAWAKPDMQYAQDQVPNSELVKNARLATDPQFRAEFDQNINENNYSRILLEAFVKQQDRFGDVDTETNTELVYKIDPEGEGFVINKYRKPLQKLETYEQAKPEFDRVIREAKGRGRKQRTVVRGDGTTETRYANSPFAITTREPDGNFSMPQPVDMPTIVNNYRKILQRMGVLPNEQYYQSLADTFTSVYGTLLEDPDYQITFKGEPITDQSFADPEFVVYTEGGGQLEYSLSDLIAKGAEESLGISEQATPGQVQDIERRIQEKQDEISALEQQIKDLQELRQENGKFTPEQYNQFITLIDQLYGPKVGQKRNGPNNLYIQKNQLEQSLRQAEQEGGNTTLDPRNDIDDMTDPQNPGDFQNQDSVEQYWNEEFEHYIKQGFTRAKIGTKKEEKTVDEPKIPKTVEPIQLSERLANATPESIKRYFRTVGKVAKKHLGLKKPLLIFTQQETINIKGAADTIPGVRRLLMEQAKGDYDGYVDAVNQRLNEIKDDVMVQSKGVAGYMQGFGGQFDIIVLRTPENLTEFNFGLMHLVLGHEMGHSFFRESMNKLLKNPLLRRYFMKEFEKAKAASPEVGQYFEDGGFEEWFVDKVSAALFDLDKGTILKSKDLSDNYINTMAQALKAFYDAKQKLAPLSPTSESALDQGNAAFFQGRFTYDESVGEFMKGIDGILNERTDLNFQDRVHAEELIDGLFGNKPSLKFMRKINKDAMNMVKTGKVPPWFTKLFFTARGFLDTLGKEKGIGKEIGQIFHKVSGEQGTPGMINEANRKLNELVNELVKRLGMDAKEVDGFDAVVQGVTGINESAFTQEEIDAFREAQDEKKPTEQLSPKAQVVRKFLFDVYDLLELQKYEITVANLETMQFEKRKIQRRPNFFPRIILVADIAAKPELKAKLIELLIEANPQIKDPDYIVKQVEKIIKNNEKSVDTASERDEDSGHGLGMPVPRARLFENLNTPRLVEEGLAAPGEVAILEYLRDITRQVELQKRGGGRRIKQLIDQLPEEERGHAKDAVNAILGRVDPIRHSAWRHMNDGVLTLNVLTLLGMAVFASVPDSAGPILRSREFDLRTITKNIFDALGKGEAEQLARDIGANGREAAAQTILYAGELDGTSLWAKKATNTWFRITQLERWTIFTRKFAAGMARDFLIKHADIVSKGYEGDADVLLSERYLKDLGVTAEQIQSWKDSGSDIDQHAEVRQALGRFVDEAIVRPNAAERPVWASDPHWAIVWQLKSFYYAYGKNIMGGLFREGKTRYAETGNITPAIMPLFFGAALLMPLTMIGWDLRERFKIGLSYVLPGISPNDPGVNYRASRDMSGGKYWFEVLDRSGMLGPGALALPLVMEDKQYGKGPLVPILGPGAERAYDLLQGEAEPFDYFPVYSQLDTRALER